MSRLSFEGVRRFIPTMTRGRWIFLLLLAFGVMAVVTSYTSLSETDDELFHVECGLEWITKGTYTTQPLHPPVARVADASLVWLRDQLFGTHVLVKRGAYMNKMVLSRLGVLPFYIFSCGLVFWWARRLFGESEGLWALGAYVTLSSVTAHAGLATTDMAYTAMFLWALALTVLWVEEPTQKRSLWLGAACALMLGTKFSALMHWPMCFLALLVMQAWARKREGLSAAPLSMAHIRQGLLFVVPVFVLVLWLVYRCDFTPLVQGIRDAAKLNQEGYGIWFYGPLNNHGVWNFFPVVFFYKTPLAFMAASVTGFLLLARLGAVMEGFPFVAALVVLVSSMASHVNLGVRHVLPMYPLLAIVAGYGMWRLWVAGAWRRGLAVVLALSQFIGFCMYQPEHIAYFNILAGEHPEEISLDSDFDWGQSMLMLDEELQRRGVKEVRICARKDALWSAFFVVEAKVSPCPTGPVPGWLAVSRAYRLLNAADFTWLPKVPGVEKIGKTMDLYYMPPRRPMPRKAPPPAPKPVAAPKNKASDLLKPLKETPSLKPMPNMTPVPMRKPTLTPAAKP